MATKERNTNNELTRLIVALVLLSAGFAAWADMAVFTNYTYDAIGQLVGTVSGYGTDGAAKMTRDYAYDLHGWPVKLDTAVKPPKASGQSSPALISPEYYAEAGVTKATPQLGNLFKERISYAGGKYPRYNGTPSARELGSGRYDYRYDALDRLTAAEFTPPPGSPADFSTAYTYDVLSRPKTIKRYGVVDVSGQTETFGVLDCMHMEYDGAHLTAVTSEVDAVEGRDFYGRTGYADGTYKDRITRSYNAAGRLTSDGGAMLGSVRYNTLGLPTMMSIASSSPEKAPRKERVYDATGCKLRQRETEYPGGADTLTEDHRYVGHFTFSADSLERMDFDGGYFDSAGNAHFLFTDWQGNVNLDVDADGNIDQHICYYPYGEPWREPKGQRQTLFAAKERQRGQLAGTYDFGPRAFNPVFLSWDSADSKSSDYPWWSPWAYCGGNPIRNIDPSGNVILAYDNNQVYLWQKIGETWGFYSYDNILYSGDNKFIGQLSNTLNELMKKPTSRNVVLDLVSSDDGVNIGEGENSAAQGTDNIYWNPEGAEIPTTEGMQRNGSIDLIHEMGHIQINRKENEKVPWEEANQYDVPHTVYEDEIDVTHLENKVRAEFGLPLRMHYMIGPDKEPLTPIINPQNGTSLYYPKFGERGHNQLPYCRLPYEY